VSLVFSTTGLSPKIFQQLDRIPGSFFLSSSPLSSFLPSPNDSKSRTVPVEDTYRRVRRACPCSNSSSPETSSNAFMSNLLSRGFFPLLDVLCKSAQSSRDVQAGPHFFVFCSGSSFRRPPHSVLQTCRGANCTEVIWVSWF